MSESVEDEFGVLGPVLSDEQRLALGSEVRNFIEAYGITYTRFGYAAARDPNLVSDLERQPGTRRFFTRTANRVRQFMESYRPGMVLDKPPPPAKRRSRRKLPPPPLPKNKRKRVRAKPAMQAKPEPVAAKKKAAPTGKKVAKPTPRSRQDSARTSA